MRTGKPRKRITNSGNGSPAKSRAADRLAAAGAGTRAGTDVATPARLPVLKTYKVFIGGKFPSTESGRYYLLKHPTTGAAIANICLCSRKDFRESVVAARAAQSGWADRSAYLRGQILYRLAEMLEGRTAQFIAEIVQQGWPEADAQAEVATSIDRLVYYAGWADKYQQVFSSVNPVASSHFNFSVLEPAGVVAILAPPHSPLLGLVSTIAPAIAGGNAVIALASHSLPLAAVTLAEVLATSDLPAGVVNLLTGDRAELLEHFANHMDVNAVVYCGNDDNDRTTIRAKSALNVKRAIVYSREDWSSADAQSPYLILDAQEVKTTWHPIGA
jgi:acyl-CoA reductase-like NAD-dependent aldehyde dehydrogenase